MSERQQKRVGEFLVRAWPENTHVANFTVIRPICFWYEQNGKRFDTMIFERKGGVGAVDQTENIDDAVTVAHGSVKWDGCTNFVIEEDDNCMAHVCSLSGLNDLFAAVAEARRFAASLLTDQTYPVHEDYRE